ncbi:hypothetical protein [Deinococcus ruber]|uniref:AP2/ERF domain-containing protein n=1 Tax=Deinococcus ruber TaxID=1848197 RepID=A0A918C8T3_9DEIO|nr:hypothetical protein [Deinococcus ruber]GGR11575.1 hypothetical protein GCM10008957_25680 [Deinococcus ruber]
MKEIPLRGKQGQGHSALVDNADYDVLNARLWYLDTSGYPAITLKLDRGGRAKVRLHRFLEADDQGGRYQDHINGNRLDNQRRNLRPATKTQNSRNRRMHKNNTSGYKGVSKTGHGTFRACINVGTQQIQLGTYQTAELAAAAYNGAARVLYASWARLNIIPEAVQRAG